MEDNELLRYSRQIMLPEIDADGQQKLAAARVLVIGLGGLGSPSAMYLASAGIGQLVLVDYDNVDLSNLQRQIIHGTSTVGVSKCESAKRRIIDINPHVNVRVYEEELGNALINKVM